MKLLSCSHAQHITSDFRAHVCPVKYWIGPYLAAKAQEMCWSSIVGIVTLPHVEQTSPVKIQNIHEVRRPHGKPPTGLSPPPPCLQPLSGSGCPRGPWAPAWLSCAAPLASASSLESSSWSETGDWLRSSRLPCTPWWLFTYGRN